LLSKYLLFISTPLGLALLLKLFGKNFALAHPSFRKKHLKVRPQIGGLVFGPSLLIVVWYLNLAPHWYILGGGISILLGTIDDNCHVPWQIKFITQLTLAIYLSLIFWGRFENITFYNFSFSISQIGLLFIFLFWFIGIYNAVNLLDGLDGLAGGFMLLLCLGLSLFGAGNFDTLNIILAIILLGFLVFNQRPGKIFMGDAGSLFLGFHTAVLPLLLLETTPLVNTLNTTPFVLLVSYLIADTTRVFFTRIISGKSPMTADTIHFHHIILQNSGSYLSSIGSIFFITSISVIGAVFSLHIELTVNFMLIHLALLLFFILTPPIQTFVPLISKAIGPLYNWQKGEQGATPHVFRTKFMGLLLGGLIISLCLNIHQLDIINWQNGIGMLLLLIFILIYRKDPMAKNVIQLGIILLFAELYWDNKLGIITKLFTIFIMISYIVFTLEKRIGCKISKFSTLDLLLILIVFGGVTLALLGFTISIWFFLTMFSLWFGTSFLLNRTIFKN